MRQTGVSRIRDSSVSDRKRPRVLPSKLFPCRTCRRGFVRWNSLQVTCSPDCAIAYVRRTEQRRRAKELKEVRKAKREFRERTKTLATLCAETQRDVNRYVRIRDQGKGCISCETGKAEDAGHFFPIGSKYRANRLRFETEAIHGQCRKCNSYVGGGNLHGYISGLEKRFGRAYVDDLYRLKERADQGLLVPLTKEKVKEIAREYRRMARELSRVNL